MMTTRPGTPIAAMRDVESAGDVDDGSEMFGPARENSIVLGLCCCESRGNETAVVLSLQLAQLALYPVSRCRHRLTENAVCIIFQRLRVTFGHRYGQHSPASQAPAIHPCSQP